MDTFRFTRLHSTCDSRALVSPAPRAWAAGTTGAPWLRRPWWRTGTSQLLVEDVFGRREQSGLLVTWMLVDVGVAKRFYVGPGWVWVLRTPRGCRRLTVVSPPFRSVWGI